MQVHLIDGTYELFRHFYAWPSMRDADGREVGAVKGVLASVLGMTREGATHLGVATDHVIESFRNDLWPGYKTGEGIDPDLRAQFPLLEEALTALGIVVWPMVEYEADDALASAASLAAQDKRAGKVLICPCLTMWRRCAGVDPHRRLKRLASGWTRQRPPKKMARRHAGRLRYSSSVPRCVPP